MGVKQTPKKILLLLVSLTALVFSTAAWAQNNNVPRSQSIKFIPNQNQWAENILYKAEFSSGTVFLEQNALTFDLVDQMDLMNAHHAHHTQNDGSNDIDIIHKHAYKMFFEGAKTDAQLLNKNPSKEYYNYLLGNDPSKWAKKVSGFGEVTYNNLYSGIDLRIYSSGINMKYDLIVDPGSDVSKIQFRYDGVDDIKIQNGELIITTSITNITELKPYAYQKRKGQIVAIPCEYVLNGNTVSFYFPEGYNKNLELIIDPELVFASYSGSSVDNWGYTATYDADGNLFGGGIAFGSGYPTTAGAYTTSYQGGSTDISISLFSADGTSLIYSTYLGGNSSELPHSLIATEDGELIIYGTTGSSDFPMLPSSYDDTFNGGVGVFVDGIINFSSGIDIYVAKLSTDGSTLIGSTFMGGTNNDGMNLKDGLTTQFNYADFARGEVILDNTNNIFVASSTTSSNFPVTAGVFQSTLSGDQEGVVFKLNEDLSSLIWSSYIGGSEEDGAYSMKINSLGEPVVCGGTASNDFPTTAGVWHSTYLGGITDGWVARISDDATSLIASTFVGTNNYDQCFFVETDDGDNIYFTGQTKGAYPVTPGVYSEANGKQFITKLNPALTTVAYSAVFGSGGSAINISPSAFLVDECENVYVSGWGGSVNSSYNGSTGYTTGMTITPDAIQSSTDGDDFYFYVLAKNGVSLLFASYFGGPSSPEHVDGGTSRFDKNGAIYQAVCAGCWGLSDFPTTTGAYSETNGSDLCNLGVIKINFNLSGIYAAALAEPSLSGCVPFNVDFTNTSIGAVDYIWDFGDGTPGSTLFEPSHTYTTPGTYDVMLIAIDSNSCNIADTSYLVINVLNDSISATFEYSGDENCDSLIATFTTTGVLLATTSYDWDFGDGTSSTLTNPTHTYSDPGEYIVTLIITDPESCNGVDTFSVTINYLYEFNTGFESVALGCIPIDATFTSNFTDGDTYLWNFGDGTSDSGESVVHTYTIPGEYYVELITYNCGIPDTVTQLVIIDGLPTAFFDDDPYYIIVNTLVTFTNLSTNAVTYEWTFGDGGTSTDKNAQHVFTELGTYNVCLTATNTNGCSDTYCRTVESEASGVVDIPTAFTPNGDGINDVLFVKGFGIQNMQLLIFNRWGELVFQTQDYKIGWDGSYHGKLQEMEVYVYSLTGNFADGILFEKKGNITLLR